MHLGLLVTAMGIRDSVGSILENQFEGIYQFDVMTTLEKEQMSPELEEALEDRICLKAICKR